MPIPPRKPGVKTDLRRERYGLTRETIDEITARSIPRRWSWPRHETVACTSVVSPDETRRRKRGDQPAGVRRMVGQVSSGGKVQSGEAQRQMGNR